MKVLLIGNQSSTIILFRKAVIENLISKNIKVYTLTMDNNEGNFNKIKKIGAIPLSYSFSQLVLILYLIFLILFFWQGK